MLIHEDFQRAFLRSAEEKSIDILSDQLPWLECQRIVTKTMVADKEANATCHPTEREVAHLQE
jgi:hypothetical protein